MRVGKRAKRQSQASESSACGWLLISACSAFVLISLYYTASSNCAETITQTLLLPCSQTSALAATECSLESWWAEVWCMVPSPRGTGPAPLNATARPGRWESAWRWESQRHWLTLSSVCKQKDRWPLCQTSFLFHWLSRRHMGTREEEGGFLLPVLCCLVPMHQNYPGHFVKFSESAGLIIQARWRDVYCCEIQYDLNHFTPTAFSCMNYILVLLNTLKKTEKNNNKKPQKNRRLSSKLFNVIHRLELKFKISATRLQQTSTHKRNVFACGGLSFQSPTLQDALIL